MPEWQEDIMALTLTQLNTPPDTHTGTLTLTHSHAVALRHTHTKLRSALQNSKILRNFFL